DTDKKDSGNYRCKVTNRFGSEWADGEVQVREKTQIFSKPTERNVTFSSDATFKCGAKTDPLESQKL
ncbi:neuroglian-like, partial [Elysia marginata]